MLHTHSLSGSCCSSPRHHTCHCTKLSLYLTTPFSQLGYDKAAVNCSFKGEHHAVLGAPAASALHDAPNAECNCCCAATAQLRSTVCRLLWSCHRSPPRAQFPCTECSCCWAGHNSPSMAPLRVQLLLSCHNSHQRAQFLCTECNCCWAMIASSRAQLPAPLGFPSVNDCTAIGS